MNPNRLSSSHSADQSEQTTSHESKPDTSDSKQLGQVANLSYDLLKTSTPPAPAGAIITPTDFKEPEKPVQPTDLPTDSKPVVVESASYTASPESFTISEEDRKVIGDNFSPDFNTEFFAKRYGSSAIVRDAERVARATSRFAERAQEESTGEGLGKTYETVLFSIIDKDHWFRTSPRSNFAKYSKVTVIKPQAYDDYNNRTDCIVDIRQDPNSDSSNLPALPNGQLPRLTFAMDFTTCPPLSKIQDKLTRSTNNAYLEAPPGYTHIKYYDDGKERGGKLMPRFVIATDFFDGKLDKFAHGGPNSPTQRNMRFKMFHQLYRQARIQKERTYASIPALRSEKSSAAKIEQAYSAKRNYQSLENYFWHMLDRAAYNLIYTVDNKTGGRIYRSTEIGQKVKAQDEALEETLKASGQTDPAKISNIKRQKHIDILNEHFSAKDHYYKIFNDALDIEAEQVAIIQKRNRQSMESSQSPAENPDGSTDEKLQQKPNQQHQQ